MIVQEPLDSELLVGCTLQMVKFIPSSMFEELISHPVEKPRDVSQVLSRSASSPCSANWLMPPREFQLTARSAECDDDDRSVSSQGLSKTTKRLRRPLSGRLTNRPVTGSGTGELLRTAAGPMSPEGEERGMKRSSSSGKTKLRTRSRSRSRGRAKTRVSPADEVLSPDSGSGRVRRVRVNSTSRILTEKRPLAPSTAPPVPPAAVRHSSASAEFHHEASAEAFSPKTPPAPGGHSLKLKSPAHSPWK
jgi:hypothetical protein